MEKNKVVHRIKKDGKYICLCDSEGNPLPKQVSLKIESTVNEPLKVTMVCLVEPHEIEDGVLKERHYEIIEDKEYFPEDVKAE